MGGADDEFGEEIEYSTKRLKTSRIPVDLPSLFPTFVFAEESATIRAIVLGDVQVGDAEGNEATRPTPEKFAFPISRKLEQEVGSGFRLSSGN